jgi:hypothetical protein
LGKNVEKDESYLLEYNLKSVKFLSPSVELDDRMRELFTNARCREKCNWKKLFIFGQVVV